MSMINEMVERLRSLARVNTDDTFRLLWGAANTIEDLSAKVRNNNLHGGWISVEDRLPEKRQVVLAIGKDSKTWDVGMFQGLSPSGSKHVWWWKKKTVKRVDYWMPKDVIPLPWKE